MSNMSPKKQVIAFVAFPILIIAIALTLVACGDNSAADPSNVSPQVSEEIVNYGNGVYYFPFTQKNFANALSSFLASHPELRLLAMSADGDHGYGRDSGYFVVFEPKR